LERLVQPAAAVVMALAAAVRRLQHGRLQWYLLYLALGLVALAVIVLAGGVK
jgi:hydrogenase-4 component B